MKKWMYYALQWTWGITMSILGLLVWLCGIVCRWRIYKYRNATCIVLPWNTGAISLGMFMARGKNFDSACPHEYGHSIQNMIWGPLFLLVIGLPSFLRCLWHEIYYATLYKKTRKSLKPYDSIWFEGQATKWGNKAQQNIWNWL